MYLIHLFRLKDITKPEKEVVEVKVAVEAAGHLVHLVPLGQKEIP
jgi:hypothetical protein